MISEKNETTWSEGKGYVSASQPPDPLDVSEKWSIYISILFIGFGLIAGLTLGALYFLL